MIELFAYADGSDLDEIAPLLLDRFTAFVSESGWYSDVWVVSDREAPGPEHAPMDLPDWNLGLCLSAAQVGDGYWADVDRILAFLKELRLETGRDFAVGLSGEDRVYVDASPLDRDEVRRMLVP